MSKLEEQLSEMPEFKEVTHTLTALHMTMKEANALNSNGELVINFTLSRSDTGDELKYSLVVKELE